MKTKKSRPKKKVTTKVPFKYTLEGRQAETDRLYALYLKALKRKEAA